MSYRMRWTLWMTAGGAATAAVVYLVTHSVGWAVVGLLGSGVVCNTIAHAVTNRPVGEGGRRPASPRR